MRLGKFELEILSSGSMAMDGGLIFGIVPRVMWEKVTPPDEKNRVRLGLNVLLIRTGEHNVIVDTGCGEGLSPKLAEIHSLDGLDVASRSELLGTFDVSYQGQNFLLRVAAVEGGVHVAAVDPRGVAAAGEAPRQVIAAVQKTVAGR